jgi:hypothetical protein
MNTIVFLRVFICLTLLTCLVRAKEDSLAAYLRHEDPIGALTNDTDISDRDILVNDTDVSKITMPKKPDPIPQPQAPVHYRVFKTAKIQVLNYRTSKSVTLDVPVGTPLVFKTLTIQAFNCLKPPPEQPDDAKARVSVMLSSKNTSKPDKIIYNNWLMLSSPHNKLAMEHPVYNIELMGCAAPEVIPDSSENLETALASLSDTPTPLAPSDSPEVMSNHTDRRLVEAPKSSGVAEALAVVAPSSSLPERFLSSPSPSGLAT